jgi:hypothetical protein
MVVTIKMLSFSFDPPPGLRLRPVRSLVFNLVVSNPDCRLLGSETSITSIPDRSPVGASDEVGGRRAILVVERDPRLAAHQKEVNPDSAVIRLQSPEDGRLRSPGNRVGGGADRGNPGPGAALDRG